MYKKQLIVVSLSDHIDVSVPLFLSPFGSPFKKIRKRVLLKVLKYKIFPFLCSLSLPLSISLFFLVPI